MTGEPGAERINVDDEVASPALGKSARDDAGEEPPPAPSVDIGTRTVGGEDAENMGDRASAEASQDLANDQDMGVQASKPHIRPQDQMSDDSGPESEPDFYMTSQPHTWKTVVKNEVTWSSKLNTTNLYNAYVNRLREQDDKLEREDGEDEEKKKPEKAPVMIRGVVDYVRVLEERIQKLEKRSKGEVRADLVPKAAQGDDESGELLMDTKFFHAKEEFTLEGDWQDNIHKKGSYQCVLDPKYLIRVLYNWADGVQRKGIESTGKPEPKDIEIIAFGMESTPVAEFFQQSLGFGTDKTDLLRFSKPFRPLIRSFGSLKAQLEKLESKFGTGTVPMPVNQSDPASVQDDSLPHASTPKEDLDNETDFDSMEALTHFRYLLQFINEYLAEPIGLYQRLRAGLDDKIAFENLWMLFDNGEKIYCPSHPGGSVSLRRPGEEHVNKPRYVRQLFQVLGTAGGLPKTSTRASQQAQDDEGTFTTSSLSEFFYNMNRASGLQQDPSSGALMPSKWRSKNKFSYLHVLCFHVDFDGVKYGTVREIFVFKPHDGLVDIRSLTAYPIQHCRPDPGLDPGDSAGRGSMATLLAERGRKFINVTASAHLSYEGVTVGQSREEINSAVIIDFHLSFQEYQSAFPDSQHVVPNLTRLNGTWPKTDFDVTEEFITSTCDNNWCHKSACTDDTYDEHRMSYTSKIDDRIKGLLDDYEPSIVLRERGLREFKQYMEEHELIDLLPGVVPGFVLRNRKWVQLNLDYLSELQQGDDWEKLVLPPGHKEMVQAMVVTHSRGSQQSQLKDQSRQKKVEMDLVQGKGRGCIILLHGVPGVGKTSTAECVAAYTRRPLYPITCGDIGYVPAEVEKNMEEHFKLAHTWGCVLLLDEADVFLAKRNKADVKRNGLVSVFLRILEYYPGILFLTTNRVGAIDDAFRSRLHLTLYYPKLTGDQTRKIWRNNLSRLKVINRGREENNQEPIHFDKKELLEWVKLNWELLQWNGRQIRNAFQTAIALAEFHATNGGAGDPSTLPRKNSKAKTKGPLLDVSHFKVIANATLQFNEYLFATHGFDEDELAKRDKIRLSSHETTLKLKDVARAGSSSSDESESEIGSDGSSSDESAKEAARKKANRKEKKKKSKAKKKSKKAQRSDSSGESDTEATEKKPKTKKKAKKVQSEGSSDESDKGADGATSRKE